MVEPLQVHLSDQVTLAVPPSLNSMTTYVLLEQESWFEKELAFVIRWLKPGMTAIDIGANLGVYALPMARKVGPKGRIFAYEPGHGTNELLRQSRSINCAFNLEILERALSDSERAGRLVLGISSELNALGHGEEGEPVQITSLDIEEEKHGWASPDFVKIDAEGEEGRILLGGRSFFERNSPLVMLEINGRSSFANEEAPAALQKMGFQFFRLLVGAPILIPLDPRVPVDRFELNLFAAKPDRIQSLRDEGVLADRLESWEPSNEEIANGLTLLRKQSFASMFGRELDDVGQIDPDYAKALAGFAIWRDETHSTSARCAALFFAYRRLAALCNRAPTTARYSTFARIAWEGGWRTECSVAAEQMEAYIQRTPFQPTEPCWPCCKRFDGLVAETNPARWFAASVAEQLELTLSLSSIFASALSPRLTWLCEQSLASREMYRRKTLFEAVKGMSPIVPSCLAQAAPDHLNADIWSKGMVPGTRIIN